MKKWLAGILVLLAALTAVLVWYFNRDTISAETSHFDYIPENSTVVLAVDLEDIGKTMMGELFSNADDVLSFQSKLEAYPFYNELLFSLPTSGIRTKERVLFCHRTENEKQVVDVLMSIKRAKKFNDFITELLTEHHFAKVSEQSYWKSDSLNCQVYWNEKVFNLRWCEPSADATTSIIEEPSSSNHPIGSLIQSDHQVTCWVKENALNDQQNYLKQHPELILNLKFEKGNCDIDGLVLSEGYTELFESSSTIFTLEEKELIVDENDLIAVLGTVNPEYFKLHDFLNDSLIATIDSTIRPVGVTLDQIVETWSGQFSYDLNKDVVREESYITYTYDDDFNKVEKRNFKNVVSPSFSGSISLKDDVLYHSLVVQDVIIEKDGIHLLSTIPYYPIQISKNKNYLKFNTPAIEEFSISDSSLIYYEDLSLGIHLNINELSKSEELNELFIPENQFGFASIQLLHHDSILKIEGDLKLINKEINALIPVGDYVMSRLNSP